MEKCIIISFSILIFLFLFIYFNCTKEDFTSISSISSDLSKTIQDLTLTTTNIMNNGLRFQNDSSIGGISNFTNNINVNGNASVDGTLTVNNTIKVGNSVILNDGSKISNNTLLLNSNSDGGDISYLINSLNIGLDNIEKLIIGGGVNPS